MDGGPGEARARSGTPVPRGLKPWLAKSRRASDQRSAMPRRPREEGCMEGLGWGGRPTALGRLIPMGPLVALAAGGHGKGSRQFWQGITTGSVGDCAPLSFNISIDEGRILGYAVSELPQQGAVSWDVSGSVTPDDRVTIETVTQDPRIRQQRVAWTGT